LNRPALCSLPVRDLPLFTFPPLGIATAYLEIVASEALILAEIRRDGGAQEPECT
jgi:hypothetical protein